MNAKAVGRLFAAAALVVLSAAGASAGERTVTLAIKKMDCPLCPLTVSTAIRGVAGVETVTVDYDKKTATVVFDDAETTVAKIAGASARAGYPASEAKR